MERNKSIEQLFDVGPTLVLLRELDELSAVEARQLREPAPTPYEPESPLRTKSFHWAVATAKAVRPLYQHAFERHFAHQVLRSATATAAAIEEANAAVSKKDFIYKIRHALKEANESKLWLKMIYEIGIAPAETVRPILVLGNEVRYMLAASVMTYLKNQKRDSKD